MTTITLPEATARAMFPDAQCAESWPDAINGDCDPSCCRFPKSCSVREPSVLWLIVDEPLVCLECWPTVEIVSVCPDPRHYILTPKAAPPYGIRRNNVHDDVRCARPCREVSSEVRGMVHGKLTIGPAVEVIAYLRGRDPERACIEVCTPTYIREWYWGEPHQQWQHRDITDRSGDQAVTPGRFAHPIVNTKEES